MGGVRAGSVAEGEGVVVRIDFNMQGFYELRSAPGVVAELDRRAEAICAAANARGSGTYATGSRQGARRPQGRWHASVVTADARAMASNAKHHVLIGLLGGSV